MEMKEKIARLLKEVGVCPSNLGWRYLYDALLMMTHDEELMYAGITAMYAIIGKRYGVSSFSVERSMRSELGRLFEKMPEDVKYEIFRNSVSGTTITNREFVGTLVQIIMTEPNNPIMKRIGA